MSDNCAVILAAGEGTRMKSSKPKVLAEVLFTPMLDWVINAVKASGIDDICVVTGHMSELVCTHLDKDIKTVLQTERLGTGHAVLQAKEFIQNFTHGNVLILNGDAPLMDSESIGNALNFHIRNENAATVISAKVKNPFGYGRIVRKADGTLDSIVEEKEATDEQRAINEVNSGAYWFRTQALLTALDKIVAVKKNKEYYLTDAIEIVLGMGHKATALDAKSDRVVLGANTRVELLELNEIARKEELVRHMLNGVSIPCTDGVIIGPGVEIGADTVILPNTIIKGKSVIGKDCEIGPGSLLEDTTVGDFTTLNSTQAYFSKIGKNCEIGPFVRLRPNTVIGDSARVGNFVEIKNSNIGSNTKISHLSYIGDSDFGTGINVGCGCATANYSGKEKFRTVVDDDAFIGCHTCLVAPVSVGKRAYTAAGSTITENVPEDALALSRTGQIVKKDWVKKRSPYKK